MAISFNCEHCGKRIQGDDTLGGKRGKCPYCKGSNYIPAPVREDELLPLAPEHDGQDEPHRQELAQLRRQEEALLSELGPADAAPVPLEQNENPTPEDLHHLVVNYCLDVFNGKLVRAALHVQQMRKLKRIAAQAVDDFADGKAKEPALEAIPPKLRQGFLAQLKKELA